MPDLPFSTKRLRKLKFEKVFGGSLLNEKIQFIVNLDLNVKLAKGYQ